MVKNRHLFLLLAGLTACDAGIDVGSSSQEITDVLHSEVERQSIGNCWIYAQASWIESMNLSATGDEMDVAQSYWTCVAVTTSCMLPLVSSASDVKTTVALFNGRRTGDCQRLVRTTGAVTPPGSGSRARPLISATSVAENFPLTSRASRTSMLMPMSMY